MTIDWNHPERGSGLRRVVDELIGPGATRAEIVLVLAVGLVGGVSMILYQYVMGLGWSLLQTAIATFMAFDIPAGVVANSTSTAKRWYHREGYGAAKHFGFVVAHVIYPLLVSVLFLPLDWLYLAIVFGLIAAAALIVIATPLYLKRPVSLTLLCVALLVSIYIITPVPGLEWLPPFLFLKLVVAHIVREEPYRA